MKLLLIFAFLIFAIPAFAQNEVPSNNIYTNATLGVGVQKVPGWIFISEAERKSAVLGSSNTNNAGLKEFALNHMSKPFVVITKPRQIPPQPAITALFAPFDSGMSTNPVINLQQMTATGFKVFQYYSLVEKPRSAKIGGKEGAYCKATYTDYLSDGRQMPISIETWYLVRGDYYFLIGAVSRDPDDDATKEEIKQIISSFKIGDVKTD